jgi:hypothetical protein
MAMTRLTLVMFQLLVAAFFFAMRSCEYMSVMDDRRMKLLCLWNIHFFLGRRALKHSDPCLTLANTISISFEYQKRNERNETVTQHRTGDPLISPVRKWGAVLQRVWEYPNMTENPEVNTFHFAGKSTNIQGSKALSFLRVAIFSIRRNKLGFGPEDVGLHSLWSIAVMAMYLGIVPVFTIILIGRWSSDAFLHYIRRQVQEFSSGVATGMVLQTEFFTIPLPRKSWKTPASSITPRTCLSDPNVASCLSRRPFLQALPCLHDSIRSICRVPLFTLYIC